MIRSVSSGGQIERGGVFAPILRARLVERISSAAQYPIVLIVAPAGYGKSLAVSQYLMTRDEPYARFDVQPEHSSLLGFLRGLTEALSEAAPDARKSLRAAYEANSTSPAAGTDLAMWLHSHIKGYVGLVVIDDLHLAEGEPRICEFLSSLISRSRGRVRWLLASRSTLGLPVGSWLAYGDMDLTIDEHDLRFTLEEARQAARSARVAVRSDELEQLLLMTDGWPTALSFALRSSTRSVDLRNIAASTQDMVYKYLAEQVYEGLSNEERQILHFVAYLDDIEVDVLRKAGYKQAKGTIEHLRDRVAFIYPERPSIYRCHDLFRKFLRHQLELRSDSAAEDVQLHVASTLESLGKTSAALRVFADAGSSDNVLRLLEKSGLELYDQGHGDIVLRALGTISHDIRATNPWVLGVRGVLATDAGRFDRAESLLQRGMARTQDPALRTMLAIRLSLILVNQMKDAAPILLALETENLSKNLRGEIIGLLAVSHAYAGRAEEAKKAFAEAAIIAEEVDDDHDRAKILHRASTAMARLGLNLEKVQTMQERAAGLSSEQGFFGLAGRCFSSLASIALFYDGDVTRETWYAQQAATASTKAGDRANLQTALLQLMDIEGRRGNSDRLQGLEKQLAAVTTSDANRLIYVVPVRAMSAAWQGNFDQAHRLMATVTGNTKFFDFDRAFNSAIDAIFLIGDSQRDEGISAVAQALALIKETDSRLPHARRQNERARIICIIVECLAGRRINAERIFRGPRLAQGPAVDALRDVAALIIRSPRNNITEEISEKLEQLSDAGSGGLSRLIRTVLERRKEVGRHSEDLTEAQIEILEELAAGRTPKEIARMTGRSLYTIQTHIQNVIRRLGCSGRNEALVVARSRGILKGT